jgi:hypothetical protein
MDPVCALSVMLPSGLNLQEDAREAYPVLVPLLFLAFSIGSGWLARRLALRRFENGERRSNYSLIPGGDNEHVVAVDRGRGQRMRPSLVVGSFGATYECDHV